MKTIQILLILLASNFVLAQSDLSLSIRSGASFQSFQDYNFSSLSYSGSGITYGLSFEKKAQNSIFSANFDVKGAKLSSNISENQSRIANIERSFTSGTISYLRARKIRGLELYIGLSNTTFYDRVDFPLQGNNQVSYELTSSLNGAIEISYSFNNKLSYTLKADLPMLSASVRPEEGGLPHMKNLEFDLGRALKSAKLYPTDKVFSPHFHHLFEFKKGNSTFGLYYDYLGGYNKVIGKKGSAIQSVGLIIPLYSK